MTPLGDLAQSLLLRNAVSGTRQALTSATQDVSTGQTSDPARHLGGHALPLSSIDSTLARNDALTEALALAATRAEVMQASLAQIGDAAGKVARSLIMAAQTGNASTLRSSADLAESALGTYVSALNQTHAGQSVFAGSAGDNPALASAQAILDAARQQTASALSAVDIATRLEQWLADPAGFGALILGNDQATTVPSGRGDVIAIDATAADPLLRSTLRGLLLGALLGEGRFATNPQMQVSLAQRAGETLFAAEEPRMELVARLGMAEARIDDARTRVSSESSALKMSRNDLLAVDPYEAASRLRTAEARLETLYAITARLSRLSLTEFLR